MKTSFLFVSTLALGLLLFSYCQPQKPVVIEKVDTIWYMSNKENAIPKVSQLFEPIPPTVTPGEGTEPPSDAIVLFDGTDFSEWEKTPVGMFGKLVDAPDYIDSIQMPGEPVGWKMGKGFMQVVKGKGYIKTKRTFQDFQLHVEWRSPDDTLKDGQDRGNSGIFLQGLYELQVLNSYQHQTYVNGQAGAFYKQVPPLVNASKQEGTWQTYDIIFNGPRFGEKGRLVHPARVTVIHNGVLIHNNITLIGPTVNEGVAAYVPHPAKMPLVLQDHSEPVRFRNIWIREL